MIQVCKSWTINNELYMKLGYQCSTIRYDWYICTIDTQEFAEITHETGST